MASRINSEVFLSVCCAYSLNSLYIGSDTLTVIVFIHLKICMLGGDVNAVLWDDCEVILCSSKMG